ncbi:MAG TPA: hypothetical protein VGI81_25735 [Tepidisphaeraceae bacterium]|jgi:hypothetical protein
MVQSLEPRQLLSVAPAATAVTPVRGKPVPVKAVEGQPFTNTTVETFTASPTSAFTATINWGDKSTPSTGTVTGDGAGNFTVAGGHDYAKFGNYHIKVTLANPSTSKSTTLSSLAKVSDAALSASGTSFTTQKGTLFVGAVATFTDADPNAVATPKATETAMINWGDGTVSAGTITQATPGGPFTVSGKHTYGVAKTFNLTTLIRDSGGSKATATGQATILGPQGTTTPTLIGDFKGSIKVSTFGVSTSHSFELQITGQDLNGIMGNVIIDGVQAFSGTLPAGGVGELTNGNVKYTFTTSGISGVVSGHISPDGKHITSGFFQASGLPVPGLSSIHGSYTADLQ